MVRSHDAGTALHGSVGVTAWTEASSVLLHARLFVLAALNDDGTRSGSARLVMHQLTDLPDRVDEIPGFAARNNRIRTDDPN
jgi:hypothetical protein